MHKVSTHAKSGQKKSFGKCYEQWRIVEENTEDMEKCYGHGESGYTYKKMMKSIEIGKSGKCDEHQILLI